MHSAHRRRRRRGLIASGVVLLLVSGLLIANVVSAGGLLADARHGDRDSLLSRFDVESLDGRGNNVSHSSWGQANQPYSRVGTAHYADGVGAPMDGPNPRAVSNRIINDANQNVFSERRVTQWGWTWGQFLDHSFGLRAVDWPERHRRQHFVPGQ